MKRQLRRLIVLVIDAGLLGAGYMLFEAQWLRVRRRKIALDGLPPELAGLKLLHISDLHAGAPRPAGRAIRKAVKAARKVRPDMILFTGDMTDKKKDLTPWLPLLSSLQAPLGIFAVLGNHDHGLRKTVLQDLSRRFLGRTPDPEKFAVAASSYDRTVSDNRRVLGEAGIRLLQNECARVEVSGAKMQVCGVDDHQYGYSDLPAVSRQLDPDASLRIMLSHSPEIIDDISAPDFGLLLSGHTHGGQICLPNPKGGKVLLSASGSRFGAGMYDISGIKMHISPGVGTTLLPFRLLSRPEITVLELA